ncbi:MAG: hypothetical protein L0323_11285 [Planctomycetes bacterium]|nr:hypothetical protein [Planctomycetota bacterium]
MRNPRIRALIEAIEKRYPATRVVVQPYGGAEDPDIHWWLWILDVPEEETLEVEGFADRRARRLYGSPHVPFFLGAVDPEQTLKHFAAVLGTPKSRRRIEHGAYGYVPAPTRKRRRSRVA